MPEMKQVDQSELEQESEQEQGRGDARVGMGTCCCSCLPLGQGTESIDPETEVVAELEPSSLEKEESQIETSSFCRILSEPQFERSHCREEQVPHCSLSPDE
ncbi:hypothetical protein NQZ68_020361 [Dissostichus eleginoides]|nr:hypothetical protein NQZ68_020361 [Dissostichus eleginoides]